jgi:glycerophosphoryl diester phosphodiesterase
MVAGLPTDDLGRAGGNPCYDRRARRETMVNTDRAPTTLRTAVSRFRDCWRPLALTDIAWKIVAFVALTPLVTLFFRARLAMSGQTVAADQDVLLIFLQPAGFVSAIVIGGLLLAIVALEQAALMAVVYAHLAGRRVAPVVALRFALAHAWPVLRLAGRMVGVTLLVAAPFLAALGLTYLGLLGDHDINFYLKERPPAFLTAAGIGGAVAVALTATLLRLFTGWLYALPLVLFEGVSPARALRASRDRARGHRTVLLAWIAGWALAVAAVSAAATSATIGLARLVVPRAVDSVVLLTIAIGTTLLAWALVNLLVNLLGNTSAAVVLLTLYRERGGAAGVEASRVTRFERDSPRAVFTLTPRRLTRWAVVGLLAAIGVGAVAVHTARLDDNVQVAAHRGSSKAAPENSLSAVKQAITDGADWVEIDVQETADGEVVVFHDSDFMKLAGVGTKIWDATLADLQTIDIGSRFSPAFGAERVPTLAAMLDACKGRVGVLIELKYYGHDKQLEEKVARLVDERGMAPQVALMSLKVDAVRKMKALRPDWRVGLLMSVAAGNLQASGADFLAVNAAFATRRFVRTAHRQGTKVYVWTVDDASTMSAMMGRGVDGVITNRPALAKAVIAQRAGLSPALRLLLELADVLGVKPQIGEV